MKELFLLKWPHLEEKKSLELGVRVQIWIEDYLEINIFDGRNK
ncbi:MAG: hypothetical protein CM1200mP30_07070 [Pseudomonadota bacterium]|nr:MAG: hypothetical protein CM1200mP30_07070 [Pseudomonadota bacterium]